MTIAVLGAGMVGRAILLDLAQRHEVTAFDLNAQHLEEIHAQEPRIHIAPADLQKTSEYKNLLEPFDIVVTAVPGFMGYRTLEAVIDAGKNVVDISFFPEDALQLDRLAKQRNVTAITDCGVAPGMSNLILGRWAAEMNVLRFECYVGGLPVDPQPPFLYKAPFSPVDVIQEYLRPARLKENGEIVTKPALSDRELMTFDEVGTLEAFNTDGLRSLLLTMPHIPDMIEKTLRYPGHVALIEAMKEAGFFSTSPLRVRDEDITPLEFTSRLLVDQWKLGKNEPEFTVMKVIVTGSDQVVEYDLFDRYDERTATSSMARTTGYTCAAAVELIAKKMFVKEGVFPPELIGGDKACFEFVLDFLRERHVMWKEKVTKTKNK